MAHVQSLSVRTYTVYILERKRFMCWNVYGLCVATYTVYVVERIRFMCGNVYGLCVGAYRVYVAERIRSMFWNVYGLCLRTETASAGAYSWYSLVGATLDGSHWPQLPREYCCTGKKMHYTKSQQ